MANTAKRIANVKKAIESGEIPGAFAEDRTTFEFPVLEYPGSRGASLQWSIKVTLLGADGKPVAITDAMLDQPAAELPKNYKAEITTIACQKGGKIRDVQPTYITEGKSLNKSNATTAITQAIREAKSKYDHKKRTAQAEETTNEEQDKEPEVAKQGLRPLPMLVKKEGETRDATLTPADFKEGVILQRKLNGVRAVTYWDQARQDMACYSRTGIDYPCQPGILAEMKALNSTAPSMRPGTYGTPAVMSKELEKAYLFPYFDGELYKHGESLNVVSGQARRVTEKGKPGKAVTLNYYIFDVFFPRAIELGDDMPSTQRQAYLDAVFEAAAKAGQKHPHLVRVENEPVHSLAEIKERTKEYLKEGYEGSIARKARAGYKYSEHNYHSSGLLKFKPIFDSEFAVVGYTQGERGKDVGAIVWICEVPDPVNPRDKTFSVVPKDMTYDMRYAIYELVNKPVDGKITRFDKDIKGLPMTIEYQEINHQTGKPLRAKALAFRTYEGGPDEDPIARLYADAEQLIAEKKEAKQAQNTITRSTMTQSRHEVTQPNRRTRTVQTARKAVGGKLPRESHAAQKRATQARIPSEPVVFTKEELEDILGDVLEFSEELL
jgi:hypothetical protein